MLLLDQNDSSLRYFGHHETIQFYVYSTLMGVVTNLKRTYGGLEQA